jgi:hypothetical protein
MDAEARRGRTKRTGFVALNRWSHGDGYVRECQQFGSEPPVDELLRLTAPDPQPSFVGSNKPPESGRREHGHWGASRGILGPQWLGSQSLRREPTQLIQKFQKPWDRMFGFNYAAPLVSRHEGVDESKLDLPLKIW